MLAGVARVELGEDPAQGRLAEAAQRLGGELHAVAPAPQPALLGELPLEPAQRADVGGRSGAELALHRLDVDVVQRRAGVVLGELLAQRVQVGQLLQHPGRLAVPQRLVALHPLAAAPVQPGAQCPQVVAQLRQLAGEVGVGERTLQQPRQLVALGRGERAHEALGGRRAAGEAVDELVDVLRLVGGTAARGGP